MPGLPAGLAPGTPQPRPPRAPPEPLGVLGAPSASCPSRPCREPCHAARSCNCAKVARTASNSVPNSLRRRLSVSWNSVPNSARRRLSVSTFCTMAAASFSCSDTVVAKDALRIFPISSLNWKTRGSESVTLCMPQLHIEPKLKEVDIFVFKRLQGTLVAPSATLVRFMCEVLCSSLRPIPHTRDYDSLDMSESCRSHSQTTQTMMQCISPWQCLCLQPISERNPLAIRAAETDIPTREVCVGPSPLCTPHMYESGMSVCSICNYIDCLQIYICIYIYIHIYIKKKTACKGTRSHK